MKTDMTAEEVTEGRARHAEQAATRQGRCRVCGLAGMHVTHDPPEYREWSVEHVYRTDYYREAGVSFHPFEPR